MLKNNHRIFFILPLFIFISTIFLIPGVSGNDQTLQQNSGNITFRLVDMGTDTVKSVELLKEGPNLKDGHVPEEQTISFDRNSNEITWDPCNGVSCSVYSYQTSGGKTGPAKLGLNIELVNPDVDVSSCKYDYTCERLKGGTKNIHGIILGTFHSGKTYEIYVNSLDATYNPSFTIKEVPT